MKFNVLVLATLLLAAHSLQAQGILIVQQETRDGKTTTNQVQIDKTHMRAETHALGDSQAFVFDGAAQVARMLNLDKKTYMELTKAQMDELGSQMSAVMKQMEEQMKNLPPAQRAQMEQMMRGGMPGMPQANAAPLQYRPAGSDKVGQWSCSKYEGFRGAEKQMEICTVDPKVLGVNAADFEVTKQFAEFMKALAPQVGDQITLFGTTESQGFSGVPVRRTTFSQGKPGVVSEIKEFRRDTFPASVFETPAGFSKQTMPAIGGRR
jgi:hypothetical protein